MKKSLRFASAALALTLAAGCAMPAFAAGKSSFSKSETVYAVMNGDGSIKSTTVSEHLYSASGLANVTDKTTSRTPRAMPSSPRTAKSWSGTPRTPMFTTRAIPTRPCPSM